MKEENKKNQDIKPWKEEKPFEEMLEKAQSELESIQKTKEESSKGLNSEVKEKDKIEEIDHFLNTHAENVKKTERKFPLNNKYTREVGWKFEFQGINAFIQTAEYADRMRIMSTVSNDPNIFSKVSPLRLLFANCHEALDARFCIDENRNLCAAFIHPLSTLDLKDLESGIKQVVQLVVGFPKRNFNSTEYEYRNRG